jgi:hypothetical protein
MSPANQESAMPNKRSPLEMARAATASARAAADHLHETTEDLTPRLAKLYTGVVHDVMRAMGLRDFTLPHTLHPVTVARNHRGPGVHGARQGQAQGRSARDPAGLDRVSSPRQNPAMSW